MTEKEGREKIECPPYHQEPLIEPAHKKRDGEGNILELVIVALATDQLGRLLWPYLSVDSAWARLNER